MQFGISFFLFVVLFLGTQTKGQTFHQDTNLSTVQLILKYGYPVQVHEVKTEDDYLLTMYRIPFGRRGKAVNRKPLLMMHGFGGQGENFIVSGMDNASMAYFFADSGYDVWIGNARGTQHSRKHLYLNPDNREFWQFSFHEIGLYDLPAKIDYILEKTKKKQLYYIGHSQGGTTFYTMCSERPEYQDKIILATLLAPAGLMKNFQHPILQPLAMRFREIGDFLQNVLFEVPPRQIPLPAFLHLICHQDLFYDICVSVYHLIINECDSGEFDKGMLPLIMRFIPSVSTRQFLHFAQMITSGRFRKWDFGRHNNMARYKSEEPPDYNLRNITVPVAVFYSLADNLVDKKDIEDTCHSLPNLVAKFLMPNPKWSHVDFIFSVNAQKQLHVPMLKIMEKFDVHH